MRHINERVRLCDVIALWEACTSAVYESARPVAGVGINEGQGSKWVVDIPSEPVSCLCKRTVLPSLSDLVAL